MRRADVVDAPHQPHPGTERRLVRRLEALGYGVSLQPIVPAAWPQGLFHPSIGSAGKPHTYDEVCASQARMTEAGHA